MNKIWQLAIQNPKSTLSGMLSLIAVTCTTLIPFTENKKALAYMAVSSALAKAYILLISKDADKQAIVTPDGGVKTVDAHSVPDAPLAKGETIARSTKND